MRSPFFLVILFSGPSAAFAAPPSQLNWCHLLEPAAQQRAPVAAPLQRVLAVAEAALAQDFSAVKELHLEGTLDGDSAHQASQAAVKDLTKVLDLAACARAAAAPLQPRCKDKALAAVLAWARTYEPTGNPINENRLIPILRAADLLSPLLDDSTRAEIFAFAAKLASQGDAFYRSMKPTDKRIPNNWGTWRLAIRSLAATVTNDAALRADTAKLWRDHLSANIKSDGSTFDFSERDALDYHLYDLEAYTTAITQTPAEFPDAWEKKTIASAFAFVRPYYVGEKQHVEFLHTTVAFDIKRRDAGQAAFQNVPWKPETARNLLRTARPFFPEIQAWSQNVVDEQYDPSVKLMAAACGDGADAKPKKSAAGSASEKRGNSGAAY